MGRVFALADLHLSQAGLKPMDVFGDLWQDHAGKMAQGWDRVVEPEDVVLLAGDLSWGRNAREAEPDLDWIGARPGRKLLLRGNHDSWWPRRASLDKIRSLLPADCEPLHGCSFALADRVVVGARGWLAPDDPLAEPSDARIFRRELESLKRSIAHADENFGRRLPRLAMLHYPPWLEGREPTAVVDELIRGEVAVVVYGHLHGADHALAVRGERNGVRYEFVAADAVAFTPVEISMPRVEPEASG
jgi:predicted phosphohydrolase